MASLALILVGLFALGSALSLVFRNRHEPWRMLLLSLPLLIVLTPGVGSSPAIRLEEVLLFLLSPWIILRKPLHRLAKIELLFLLYGIAIVISIGMGFFLDGSVFFRDFFELVRLFKYWLIVRLAMSLPWQKKNIADALWVLAWTGLLAALISMAQARNVGIINSLYSPLFVKGTHLEAIARRPAGTLQNYNLFGAFLAMGSSVVLALLLFARLSRKHKLGLLAIFAAMGVALVQTTSRGSFVALALATLVLVALRIALFQSRRWLYSLILVVVTTVSLLGAKVIWENPQDLAGFPDLQSFVYRSQPRDLLRGLESRWEDWELAVELSSDAFVFGSGPSKDENIRAFHSEYLTHLRRYGIFGLTIYVVFMVGTGLTVLRLLLQQKDGKASGTLYGRALLAGSIGVLLVFFVTSGVYQVFQQLQLAAIFWWYVGVSLAYAVCLRTAKTEARVHARAVPASAGSAG